MDSRDELTMFTRNVRLHNFLFKKIYLLSRESNLACERILKCMEKARTWRRTAGKAVMRYRGGKLKGDSEESRALTKHSAASSIMPSWNRCSSWKVLARAQRRASEGSTFSLLNWNCTKML